MPNTTLSPNMNLVVPTVGVDPGPDWANNINADLSIVDSHNHSSGQGVQITPSGLNINSDLPFNSNNATLLRTSRYSPQGGVLSAAADVGCLYVVNNELYYNDVTGGHQIPITNNGAVNAGAGSITGLPSGTASASYSAGTFVWQSATNTPANMDAGSYVLRNAVASSKGLTLQPPAAMASNYSVTLPALPANTSYLYIDASGNITATQTTSSGVVTSPYEFKLNGNYGSLSVPSNNIDGLCFFSYNATIVNVWAWIKTPGSGGTTRMDVKLCTTPGGAFATIFSVDPQFASTAATDAYVDSLGTAPAGTGVTAPVLSTTNISAGSALRFDLITAMTGNPDSCGITIQFQQR